MGNKDNKFTLAPDYTIYRDSFGTASFITSLLPGLDRSDDILNTRKMKIQMTLW